MTKFPVVVYSLLLSAGFCFAKLNAQRVGPGVYYVKYSDGIWQKKAVLQK